MSRSLRKNQKNALEISVNNNFESGIHYHATGSGKSWIAAILLEKYHKIYPKNNVFWICERKDILKQQFNKKTLIDRGFNEIIKKFNVLDFVNEKNTNWYDSLNSAKFWGKPYLCIINRSFLTTKERYKSIKNNVGLVIHDECHSIENETTKKFYKWLQENTQSKVIGFSATPELISPLDKILSKYSIYDAFLDNVIVPPKIMWIKGNNFPKTKLLIDILKTEIDKLPYKKIIVWCGIIDECLALVDSWSEYFQDYDLCIDFNSINRNSDKVKNYKDYEYFYNTKSKSIMFCAVKHREGSDIPNLDGCIFMDKVEKRSNRVFIQCMGRVLRHDSKNKKKYGLVIDLMAKSTIEVCNRIQYYLQLTNIFPWKYKYDSYTNLSSKYSINFLDMIKNNHIALEKESELGKRYTKTEICKYFRREYPDNLKYQKRLDHELQLVIDKNLFENILRGIEILDLTKNIPHITRGSCGSSLICYLIGISHIDPIKYNISFARFLNKYRNNLPDIDFDFPHYLRDEVFLKLFQRWGNRVARISNHNYYHEKSALREAFRINGIRKFISKYDINRELKSLDMGLKKKILATAKNLEGNFRGFSLHCGGIIYFPKGIPEDIVLNNHKSILQQVNLNKNSVSKNKNFKIDILSSRGLSQLHYCCNFSDIDFNQRLGDPKTIELLENADNIGITLAETPLMRKAILLIKPKTIMDLAICLAIIRPAAKDAKREFELGEYKKHNIVFDDDVIFMLSRIMNCDEDIADKLRRGFCKDDKSAIEMIEEFLKPKGPYYTKKIKRILSNLRQYGFCKAHAISYAQLVWQLAYEKANNPKKFWISTLKNVKSCYRKWVHLYEARCHDVVLKKDDTNRSIYQKKKDKSILDRDNLELLQDKGYWNMVTPDFYENCYFFKSKDTYIFKGLIASSRMLNYGKNKKLVLFVGVGKGHYIEVVVKGDTYYNTKKVIVQGKGELVNKLYKSYECETKNVSFI